jgi:hypothetical protein
MNENPQGELGDQKAGRLKRTSPDKFVCLIQQKATVLRARFITGELDQIAAVKEVAQERLFLARKWRSGREGVQKLDRSLARHRQLILLGYIPAQNIGNSNTELIRCQFVDLALDANELIEGALSRRLDDDRPIPPAFDQPGCQSNNQENACDPTNDHPGLEEEVIRRPGDVVKFLCEKKGHLSSLLTATHSELALLEKSTQGGEIIVARAQ